MSMHDLCLIEWTEQLKQMGVASLKIEGRLKTAAWVSRAVALYRRALDGGAPADELRAEAESLGDYTGRELTDGYMRAERSSMTGESRRAAGKGESSCSMSATPEQVQFSLSVKEDDSKGTILEFTSPNGRESYRIPPQRIANQRRAITVQAMLDAIKEVLSRMKISSSEPECSVELRGKLLPKNAVNQAVDAATSFMRSILKEDDGLPRGVKLPPEVDAMLKAKVILSEANCMTMGSKADRVRVNWDEETDIPAGMVPIVCCYPMKLEEVQEQIDAVRSWGKDAIVSLPQVMYEEQLPAMGLLIETLVKEGHVVEVNSWDGWQLLREIEQEARFEVGPGLAVLNAFAAKYWWSKGAECIAISQEIDKLQLECLCQASEVPLALTSFSCPPLMMTRAELPATYAAGPFTDARGIELSPNREGPLTVLRPSRPSDWRKLRNEAVHVAHIVWDWRGRGRETFAVKSKEADFLFNYDRTLR